MYIVNYLDYRSISEISKSISYFDSFNLKNTSLSSLCSKTIPIFKGMVTHRGTLTAKLQQLGQGVVGLYRARKNEGQLPFESIEELWNPPQKIVKMLGRCNNANESILYCSESIVSALLECGAKPGETWTIARFVHLDSKPLKEIRFQAIGIDPYELLATRCGYQDKFVPNLADAVGSHNLEKNKIFHDYIKSAFMEKIKPKENYKYKRTISISKYFLDDPKVDSIAYPSVHIEEKSLNFAIKPELAREHMIIDHLSMVEIKRINYPTIFSSPILSGQAEKSGKIVWSLPVNI